MLNNGTQIAQSTFTEDGAGSGNGTIDLSGYGSFDQIIFTGLAQTDATDGSDFIITDITFPNPNLVTSYDDSIVGGDGLDTIFGGDGNDTIMVVLVR